MNAIVIYESLTGNTKKAALLIGKELRTAGVDATVCSITVIDYQSLADADLVIVGSWTDGFVFFGQKPGRSSRVRSMPALAGKKAFVFCTYAVDQGQTLPKLTALVEGRGAEVLGGMAIRRTRIAMLGALPEWQGRGLASRLFALLMAYAKGRGVRGFTADVLVGNAAMLGVFERSGCTVTKKVVSGTLEITMVFP